MAIVPDYYYKEWRWSIVEQRWQGNFDRSVLDSVPLDDIADIDLPDEYKVDDCIYLVAIPQAKPDDPNNPTNNLPLIFFKYNLTAEPPEPPPLPVVYYWINGSSKIYHTTEECRYVTETSNKVTNIDGLRMCRECRRLER